ncbi:Hsp70 family protein [Lentzea sp. NBRC 105346]|uniref:Hsp70 family protein n=1 Tax=Lentzea sp. NBRC 105346 TaxID=3032205 RepID=UPI002555E1CD|nr:Hsp70 family protein [Lentzea sp. NBRC 105346]
MVYQLGVDLGTTFTAAAVHRPDRPAEVVALGTRSASVASVLYLAAEGNVLVGEAAERRAVTDPERVAREFKRRIGDPTPMMFRDQAWHAHELTAELASWVVDRVTEREGEPPGRVAITHPAGWGPHKRALLAEGLAEVGLDDVVFLTEPEAAALNYASAQRIEPGRAVAVYDLGGGTFDAAVLRRTESEGFELLGRPEGIERLGGIDFDELVFEHVRACADLDSLDPEDPVTLSTVARLRRECTEAKEALSSDTEVQIPVLLPSARSQVRLTRSEFEHMIRPALTDTLEALRRTVRSSGLDADDLAAVLLVGGSSRIPLVTQLISEELGRPVAVDTDQHTSVATGAALAAQPPAGRAAPPTRPVVLTAPLTTTSVRRRKRPRILLGAAGLVVLGAAALAATSWPDRSSGSPGDAPTSPTPTPAAPHAPQERRIEGTTAPHHSTAGRPTTSASRSGAAPAAGVPVSSAAPTTTVAPRAEPTTTVAPPVTTTASAATSTASSEPPPPPPPPSGRRHAG